MGEVPTNGSELVAGDMPTGGFATASSVLTDVLLTLVGLTVR